VICLRLGNEVAPLGFFKVEGRPFGLAQLARTNEQQRGEQQGALDYERTAEAIKGA